MGSTRLELEPCDGRDRFFVGASWKRARPPVLEVSLGALDAREMPCSGTHPVAITLGAHLRFASQAMSRCDEPLQARGGEAHVVW